ncbi:MAG TPA: hypothetical protein VIN93_03190 [Bryobacteraceae bacterium]|jgi:hypothetical protein
MVMGIYDPLKDYLKTQTVKSITFAFGEIEAIIGRELPRAAYDTDTWWWAQTCWNEVGWKIAVLERLSEKVTLAH